MQPGRKTVETVNCSQVCLLMQATEIDAKLGYYSKN